MKMNSLPRARSILMIIIFSAVLLISINAVHAQSIISGSNKSISSIDYSLDYSDLDINDYNSTSAYVNTTIYSTITYAANYSCTLQLTPDIVFNANSSSYMQTGVLTGQKIVHQDLIASLSDGEYNVSLTCNYAIVKTNQTSIQDNSTNMTNTSTITSYYNTSIFSTKNIFADANGPRISLDYYNYSITSMSANYSSANYMIQINFTTADITPLTCQITYGTINSNGTINSSGTINYIPDYDNALIASEERISQNSINISTNLNSNITLLNYNITCTDFVGSNNSNSSQITMFYTGNGTNSTNQSVQEQLPSLTLNKPAYNLGEIGYYTINAMNGSNVTITTCPMQTGWVQCYMTPEFINDVYPKTQALPYSNKTGAYFIEAVVRFNNSTYKVNVTYNVVNTIASSITVSKSTIGINDIITLSAQATGGIGSYNYLWFLHDNTTMRGQNITKNFTQSGSLVETLLVNDTYNNNYTTNISLYVKRYYSLTVIALDRETGSRMSGVDITVGNTTITTNSIGQSVFNLIEEGYDVYASKDNYGAIISGITLDQSKTLYINMSFIDITPPGITLLTAEGQVFNQGGVQLKFEAADITNLSCSLYIAPSNESWYTLKDSGDDLLVNTEYTFTVTDLGGGDYKWKIDCTDKEGNKNSSEERTFSVLDAGTVQALDLQQNNTDEINSALDNIYTLSGAEAEVVDLLHIKDTLRDILDKNANLDRDIHNLQYRRDLNDTDKVLARQGLTDAIEIMKQNTPINIKITASKTFVKYIKDQDLKPLLDQYLAAKNLNIKSAIFIEAIKNSQSKTVISTKARNVDLYYLDGTTKQITIITKDIAFSKPEYEMDFNNSLTISFLESIPKNIAADAKELNIINTEYTLLKSDPLLEFPAHTTSITYYLNKTINLQDTELIDTIVIDKNANAAPASTGFSVLGITSLKDITSDGKTMLIALAVILVLVYLFITFGIFRKIKEIFGGGKKKATYIKVLVNDSLDQLAEKELEKACLIYREIKLNYESSSEYVKKSTFDECYDLCNKLDMAYFDQEYNNLLSFIEIKDSNSALITYDILEKTYAKIDEKYRKEYAAILSQIYLEIKKMRDGMTNE